ncbi:MAG: hypothetical protein GX107_04015 [Clostridiales bacterium]|jgi:hypothetical protein|nr:hypothetical protein [Clostridiales bacterium]
MKRRKRAFNFNGGCCAAGGKACLKIKTESKTTLKKIRLAVLFALTAAAFFFSSCKTDVSEETKPSAAKTAKSETPSASAYKAQTEKETASTTDKQYENIVKTYDLSAGIYTAGIDIPAGLCNIAALSGKGNLYSSNFVGGINELFGVGDTDGIYKESFLGLRLPINSSLTVTSGLKVKLFFTSAESGYKGRRYDETAEVTLKSGKYISGMDFTPGTFKVTAESGSGMVYSSNTLGNGINEVLAVEDSTFGGTFMNAEFPEGTEVTVGDGLIVKIIPAV